MGRLFGTDGVRGIAGTELTVELAHSLGRAAAASVGRRHPDPGFVVGRDTRASGGFLGEALIEGMLSAGANVLQAGVIPTPAVAYLVGALGAAAGAVISGSHNPAEYNGIKFFGEGGFKLPDAQEDEIESLLEAAVRSRARGLVKDASDSEDLYQDHCLKALGGETLEGLKIVVDCANGAAYRTAPRALREAGAETFVINDRPDGNNINVKSGSTSPQSVAAAVVRRGADAGLALDGDADRIIAVDEKGGIVDGDAILALLAAQLKDRGLLARDVVVTTVMANLGFRRAMATAGIEIIETDVGDRYVLEAMLESGARIGGEQSGHIILLEHATTGDGLITALRFLSLLKESARPLSDVASSVPRFPQILLNVPVADRGGLESAGEVWAAVDEARDALGASGRVLLRPSGTEPVVRVMVQATEESLAVATAESLSRVVKSVLG